MAREANSPVDLVTKYLLFFVNFSIFIVSGAVVCLLAWVLKMKEKEVKSAYDFFLDPSIVFCLAGCIAFVVSSFGWVGPFRENVLCLKIYSGLLTFWFFVQIVLVVLLFLIVYVPDARDKLGIYPEETLKTAIENYREDEDLQDLIDGIQLELKCCGVSNDDEGYKDWTNNEYFHCETNLTKTFEFCFVPYSCCIQDNDGLFNFMCGKDMQDPNMDPAERAKTIYTVGCLKAITDFLKNNVLVVGGVLIGIFIPQVLLVWLTRTLISQIEMQMAKWNIRQ